jgi:hypothetical protein
MQAKIAAATSDITAGANVNLTVGQQFTVTFICKHRDYG